MTGFGPLEDFWQLPRRALELYIRLFMGGFRVLTGTLRLELSSTLCPLAGKAPSAGSRRGGGHTLERLASVSGALSKGRPTAAFITQLPSIVMKASQLPC